VTLDLDSSVIGVHGSQEGAYKGFNSSIKGQKSYHPERSFVAETRECLHNWDQSGSAYTKNGGPDFVKKCFSTRTKRVWKVFVRADSGFGNGELLEVLEQKQSDYLIKVFLEKFGKFIDETRLEKSQRSKGD
jgi:hypothetical protein